MNVTAIRGALKTALATVNGFTIYDYEPQTPNPPCIICIPDDPFIEPHLSMGVGAVALHFTVTPLVQINAIEDAQNQLDALLSMGAGESLSIFDAIESDETLGGLGNVMVEQVRKYGQRPVGEITYLGAELPVIFHCQRT